MSAQSNQRELLSSRLGFILVAAGCAIGIGNVWKFPYITGMSGGGIFVLIYFAFLLLLGIPVLCMELGVGRASRLSPIKAFKHLEPEGTKWHAQGWVSLVGSYLLMMFYTTVAGWMLHYIYSTAKGTFAGEMPAGYTGEQFNALLNDPSTMCMWMILVVFIGSFSVGYGLIKGVERISKTLMLILLGIMVVLAINSVMLDGGDAGLEFYLVPNVDRMKQIGIFNVIYNAMSHAFFTLSIGVGSMAIFGSYMKKTNTILKEGITIALLDTAVAIVAGLIIFPACFAYNVQPNAGPGLLFVTLPEVFNRMPLGQFWGAMFFIFMSFASLSTVIAVFENIITCCSEQFEWSRKKSALYNFFIISVLSVPCVLGFSEWTWDWLKVFGGTILDVEDFIVSYCILPLGGMVFCLFCTSKKGWGIKGFYEEANTGDGVHFKPWMRGYLTYVLPLIVLTVFVLGICEKFHLLSLFE